MVGGRYRLIEHIGSGGASAVWRGRDERLGRTVAVKLLGPEREGSELVREARAAARLSNPHVGTVYDVGETGDGPGGTTGGRGMAYLVMEFIAGPSLAQRLKDGVLGWRPALELCAEVADGLAATHSAGLVHRDVKPANVMLCPTGAKLVDFGISAEIGEPADEAPDGCVVGTPAYVSPERLAGSAAMPAADVYALGLLLYRALTGWLPWDVDSRSAVLRAHLLSEPAPLPPIPGLPIEVAEDCTRCLAKDPARRPSAAELADAWCRLVPAARAAQPTTATRAA
jgi:eukaryotic-like serine/threonine-protein kinase